MPLEDLPLSSLSDKYQLILPNFELTKNFETRFNGSLEMSNLGYNKLFDTNINEKVFINNLTYTSLDEISSRGLIQNFEISLKNFNADSKNSKNLKNKQENNLQGILQFNSKLPLIKNAKITTAASRKKTNNSDFQRILTVRSAEHYEKRYVQI